MIETAVTVPEESKRHKPTTMEDVAKLAGVHARTVADALKGTGRVAPSTRERVLRIARELNYVPNAAARALVTGRTGKVAVVSGPINEPFYTNMVHSLEMHLTSSGFEMLLLHTRREVDDLVQATQSSLVDGVIVIGSFHLTEEFRHQTRGAVQPCVFINISKAEFVDHIFIDLRPAVEDALQLMLGAKRRRIAYVVNNRDADSHTEMRMATYLKVMEEAGRTPEFIDVNTSMPPEKRVQDIKAYIEQHGCPDALLCQNDETAIYTYRALTALGLRLPNDAVLVGCDGLPYMEFFDPPLSTIALPTEDICGLATQFLQRRMANPNLPLQEATLEGHLIVRKSMELQS